MSTMVLECLPTFASSGSPTPQRLITICCFTLCPMQYEALESMKIFGSGFPRTSPISIQIIGPTYHQLDTSRVLFLANSSVTSAGTCTGGKEIFRLTFGSNVGSFHSSSALIVRHVLSTKAI